MLVVLAQNFSVCFSAGNVCKGSLGKEAAGPAPWMTSVFIWRTTPLKTLTLSRTEQLRIEPVSQDCSDIWRQTCLVPIFRHCTPSTWQDSLIVMLIVTCVVWLTNSMPRVRSRHGFALRWLVDGYVQDHFAGLEWCSIGPANGTWPAIHCCNEIWQITRAALSAMRVVFWYN